MDLLKFIGKTESFSIISDSIGKKSRTVVTGVKEGFDSYLAAGLFASLKKPLLATLPDEQSAEIFYRNIANFVSGEDVIFLPAPEIFTVEEEIISEIMFERVETLVKISARRKPFILVSQPAALAKKVPSLDNCRKSALKLIQGKRLKRDELIRRLFDSGFEEAPIAEQPGDFARRGGIIDFYPLNSAFPLRVEFQGSSINSIRKFQASSQLSFEKIESFELIPVNESFIGGVEEKPVDLLKGSVNLFFEPEKARKSPFLKELADKNIFEKDSLHEILDKSIPIYGNAPGSSAEQPAKIRHLNVFRADSSFKIAPFFTWEKSSNEKLFIFSENQGQTSRIKEILKSRNIDTRETLFLKGVLSSGFRFPEAGIAFLSNDELFERYRARHTATGKTREHVPLGSYSEIKKGDYVVHYNEGIGIFEGLETLDIKGEKEEFIAIRYQSNDMLYVPVRNISLVHKYIGEKNPALSKLNSKNWARIKEKVKNSISDLASDLYNLYKERKEEKGFSFSRDDHLQKLFDASFIYSETPDQAETIKEVKKDMVSGKMMDRIVCGDAGYGKTEVALRASFKAVISGRQVAVLVPTTVLALQHYLTFKERFADFPVRIEMLSRLNSRQEQQVTLKNIKTGHTDIVIGTHRLLQKDVGFKSLGLLIIDEEQRFGVTHKEKIKTVFKKVDALTLTATPIPRTLYMALSGIKDISVITTPPQGRISVVTYVGKQNDKLVKEAVIRELERKGQVFYLHNFIYDIEKVREKLANLVPFAKIECAHGRMAPDALAGIMKRFSRGETDILVATTIVENGIDIPRANTLIVDNAHRYGLADLYQLRGRVGRYKWRAYAYFLIPPHVYMTETARERLKALQELNRPGSGYKIALKDLEIRGAGNVLGKQQHGFIDQIGFNLYCRFWQEITGKTGDIKPPMDETADIRVKIPEDYISDPSLRFYVYKKLASLTDREEASLFREELRDRFGPVPPEIDMIMSEKA